MGQSSSSVMEWTFVQEMKCELMKDSLNGISQFPSIRYDAQYFSAKKGGDKKFLYRKLFQEHLIQKEDSQFTFNFDPLFIFESGKDAGDSLGSLYRNSRGVQVSGSIGKKFFFQSAFLENQAIFPQHVRRFVALREVSPGQGRTKIFKTNGSDFGLAWGNFFWRVNKNISLSAGHGKNFIGSGYRSLLLSDNAFFYPYLKTTFQGKKWSYTHSWAMLQDIYSGRELFNPLSEALFVRKLFTWQYFTYNPIKNLEAGVFYSAIWTHTNASAALPLPLVQHLQPYPAGSVNPLFGINLSYKPINNFLIYGQWLMDGSLDQRYGSKNTRTGWQAGSILNEIFKVKGLTLQAEINNVEPQTYAQANRGFGYHNGYFHYNQSLTHPLGSNFTEGVGIINYRFKGAFICIKGSAFNRIKSKVFDAVDIDPIANYGENIGPEPLPVGGIIAPASVYNQRGLLVDAKLGYVINKVTRLKAYFGIMQRNASGDPNIQYIYFGLGTQVLNQYFDF